jgi:hypothetical protein
VFPVSLPIILNPLIYAPPLRFAIFVVVIVEPEIAPEILKAPVEYTLPLSLITNISL